MRVFNMPVWISDTHHCLSYFRAAVIGKSTIPTLSRCIASLAEAQRWAVFWLSGVAKCIIAELLAEFGARKWNSVI